MVQVVLGFFGLEWEKAVRPRREPVAAIAAVVGAMAQFWAIAADCLPSPTGAQGTPFTDRGPSQSSADSQPRLIETVGIAALVFGLVESLVGIAQQGGGVGAILRKKGDADASANV